MGKKQGYMFTNKEHPTKAIMSTILGVISFAGIGAAIFLTYRNAGLATMGYGAGVFLATLFAFVGLGLGIASKSEKECYFLFPVLGIAFNFLALVTVSLILYAGVNGI